MKYSKIKKRILIYRKLDNLMSRNHENKILFELFNYLSVYYFKIMIKR